jgi:hypothetical protein
MWEYSRVKIDYQTESQLITELNILGSNGWEIINYFEEPCDKWHEHKVIVLLKRLKSKNIL